MYEDSDYLALTMKLQEAFTDDEMEVFKALREVMKRVGLSMRISSGDEPYLFIGGSKDHIEEKKSRNAGRKQVEAKDILTVGEVRDRIKNGEKVGDIATELGMSQRTLYRRLEKEDHEYI